MATYYIDPSAAVNGSGTEISPYNSWASVSFAAGNTYLQKRGTLYSGEVQCYVAATAAAPIVIGAYGSGALPRIDGADAGKCFTMNTLAAHIHISDFELFGADTGINKTLGAGTNVKIENCAIHDCTTGIAINGHDCVVRGCSIYSMGQDGIFSGGGERLLIENNDLWDISTTTVSGDGIQIADGASYNCSGFRIRNNRIRMSRAYKQAIIVQRNGGTSVGGVISGNDTEHVSGETSGATKNIYVDVPGVIVVGNRIVGGNGGIWCESADVRVLGNIVVADDGMEYAVLVDEGVSYIVANTLVGAAGVGIATAGTGVRYVHDNIISGAVIGLSKGASGTTDSHNCYDGVGTRNNSGTGDVVADPLLTSDYRLSELSPCRGAGIYVPGAKHMGGQSMNPSAPDIGAYRYREPARPVLFRAIA